MYPISFKTKDKLPATGCSDKWIKVIQSDMKLCVSNLKKNRLRSTFKSKDITNKRLAILNFCAIQMMENTST